METLLLGLKLIGAGLAAISLAGSGVGIGVVFAGFLNALSRNPKDEKKLLTYALLGFALTTAIVFFWFNDIFFNFISKKYDDVFFYNKILYNYTSFSFYCNLV
jgi:F0F1-type ATP synthase membrane subunit c/vacuolar-type H+-ATPase subunit K